ncbi:MAG: phosphoesterase [Caulobacterales bacterium 68-7]|nr:ligase-associated DNA damage response endonuclease PdeM [Caulobacterales bacterium]OJU13586.1 MAG: phosphoesterase [Caulobacterales bacterium 68-7]
MSAEPARSPLPPFAGSDCGGLTVEVHGAEALLRCSGAMWLPASRTLAVADLHFEKGSAYAARGQMLPPYDTRETLNRLEAEVAALAPAVLVFMGDTFHDSRAESRIATDDLARVAALASGRTLVWVIGNHDEHAPLDLPGDKVDDLAVDGLTLRHEPQPGLQPGEAAGHLHPCVKVAGRGRAVRRRAFVTDGLRVILPAFGAYAGGLNIMDKAFAGLFCAPPLSAALGANKVHAIGWRSLRPD